MNRIARYFDPQADHDVVSYDAKGDIVPSDGTTTFTFDGRHVEPLQYNMTRQFHPTVGQRMSKDPSATLAMMRTCGSIQASNRRGGPLAIRRFKCGRWWKAK